MVGRRKGIIRVIVIMLTLLSISFLAACSSANTTENVNKTLDKEVTPQFSDQIDKSNMTEAEKKMSTDLLYLIKANESQSSSEPIINSDSFQSSNFIPADPAKGINEDLVHVYVYLNEGTNIDVIQPFVQEISGRDEENSVAAAWVSVNKLQKLASMEEVRNIRTIIPPVTNTDSDTGKEIANNSTGSEKTNYLEDGSWIKIIGIVGFAAIILRHRDK